MRSLIMALVLLAAPLAQAGTPQEDADQAAAGLDYEASLAVNAKDAALAVQDGTSTAYWAALDYYMEHYDYISTTHGPAACAQIEASLDQAYGEWTLGLDEMSWGNDEFGWALSYEDDGDASYTETPPDYVTAYNHYTFGAGMFGVSNGSYVEAKTHFESSVYYSGATEYLVAYFAFSN